MTVRAGAGRYRFGLTKSAIGMALLPSITPLDAISGGGSWVSVVSGLESLFTAVGIVVAGWWTYSLFVRQRQRYPRATLDITIHERPAGPDLQLAHVCCRVVNIGNTLVEVDLIELRLQRVAPLSPRQYRHVLSRHNPRDPTAPAQLDWPLVGHRVRGFTPAIELEPGEAEDLWFDIAMPGDIRSLLVSAHVVNCVKRGSGNWFRPLPARTAQIGWKAMKLYAIGIESPAPAPLTPLEAR